MEKTKKTLRKTLPAGIAKVLKRLHYPVGVRWYVAYSLSTRNLEEMMAERGLEASLRAATRVAARGNKIMQTNSSVRASGIRDDRSRERSASKCRSSIAGTSIGLAARV